jgi:hypothetical protein
MKKNYRFFLLIAGIVVIFYTFISLQFLLGMIVVGFIVIALIVSPQDE